MAKTLKLKTRNLRIVANLIEKNAKAGKTFNLDLPHSDDISMGCIGAVLRDYVMATPRLAKIKAIEESFKEYGFYKCEELIKILLGIPPRRIWLSLDGSIWGKYNCINPNAKQAVTMLRNLADGTWNFDDYEFYGG